MQEQRLKPRKVLELPSHLAFAIRRRVFVVNETKDCELEVDSVEVVDGSKPRLLIRVKRVFTRRRQS
jgi:hypothetical protein